jgi:hypothetical protein
MENSATRPPASPPSDIDALIVRHGIVRVTVEHFEYGGYRYSAPEHAIAEAERCLARKVRA